MKSESRIWNSAGCRQTVKKKTMVPLRCLKIFNSRSFKICLLFFGVLPILYTFLFYNNVSRDVETREKPMMLNNQIYNIFHKQFIGTKNNVRNSLEKIESIQAKVNAYRKQITTVQSELAMRTPTTLADSHKQTHVRTNTSREILPECNTVPPDFKGRETVVRTVLDMDKLESLHGDGMELGGRHRPTECSKPYRVAIILPYRDRDTHFKIFLNTVIPKLKRQLTDFTIFRIEQEPGESFNRGMMRNVGFLEVSKLNHYDCFVFNDVDTIIEDDRNVLRCDTKSVYHLISGVDRYRYKLMYYTLIGGIIGFTKQQFTKCNGYSNSFFMWGAEDDNMFTRLRTVGNYSILRPNVKHGLVTTLKHTKDRVYNLRNKLHTALQNYTMLDGLNTIDYEVINTQRHKLYTNFLIRVNKTTILQNLFRFAPELKKEYVVNG